MDDKKMIKCKGNLSIGLANANVELEFEIDPDDVEDMTPEQRIDYINECAREDANNYIEIWAKEVPE